MTTRNDARSRVGDARRDPDARAALAASPGPSLPERLLSAREHKGVDLFRAERDTKIRARYLAALERGDYRELPGAVYTKGFLRNYALYLGLDPDDVLVQWRRERGESAVAEPMAVVPRAIAAPRQGLTFSPRMVGGLLLGLVVVAVVAYVVLQLVRFNKPPAIVVTDPAAAVTTVAETATSYTLRGTSLPGALVSVTVPGRDQPVRATAGTDGTWSVDVELRRGKNQFSITATDPDTGKQAENPTERVISVPFSVVVAPTLTLDQPVEGATFQNGAILVAGTTTDASQVTVSAVYAGPIVAPTGGTPGPTPAAPAPQTATVAGDGTFSVPFQLTAGRWSLTVTAASADGKTVALGRSVAVQFKGVNLVVSIKGGAAWLKVWVDGALDPRFGEGGKTLSDGQTASFQATKTIEVRTGKSSVTFFTLNGQALGSLGSQPNPETWLFSPPDPPKSTGRR